MKRFLVFTLVLTLIFPAYCFSAPSGVPVCEKYDKLIEELIDEIKWIMEDGKVEEEEIAAIEEDLQPNNYLNPICLSIIIRLLSEIAGESPVLAILLYTRLLPWCIAY